MQQGDNVLKITRKRAHLTVLLMMALILTGCYQNPITNNTPKKTISVLRHAAMLAEKKMGIEHNSGWSFGVCMNSEPSTVKVDCSKLFNLMLPLVKKEASFKHLTMSQLMNKDTFEPLLDEYDMHVFNSF